ncbi:hypothetical protein PSTT_13402 [Puccinia striiformis]|uniref:F-box domain-containing protein n=1 Tax=Puccinia striiformis TaxID=27350 RepID=A0A2S4US72_9BASI|nr:hypothetical protein PSTT_13402 [Puccinia striiformis]
MDRLPNEIKHRIAYWVDKLDTEWGSPELLKLALVDRTFNGICSRPIWQRQILESSPNLKDLGVYLETTPRRTRRFRLRLPGTTNIMALPQVSQLVNLTEIWLAPSWHQISFTEDFLVRLIRDMVHLEYFGCYGIDAKRIVAKVVRTRPLLTVGASFGQEMASLPSLVHLELGSTSCFDWNWSKIPWKGALSNIKLVDCWRASPGALHQFCMLFESSLTSLDLNNVPAIGDDEEELDRDFPEEASNQYQFRLPCLEFLSIRQLPVTFCELFRESHAIERLQIYKKKYMTPTDFDFFFEGRSWMNLRTLSIVSGVWDRKPEFISLADRGLRKGIQVELDEELDLETKTDYDSSDSEDSSSDEDI